MGNVELLMRLVSYSIFGIIGYFLPGKLPPPKGVFVWMVLMLVIFLSPYEMVGGLLIGVGPTGIYLNSSVQGLASGILCGFGLRGRASIVRV